MDTSLKDSIKAEYNKRFPQKKFIPGESVVPVSGKIFDAQEMIGMTEAVLEGWWTEGHVAEEFEKKLAEFVGVKFCTTVNSGSSANLTAFTALTSPWLGEKRIKAGDEVITIAASFPTTVNPIIQNGCVPVFVDIEMKTLSIDTSQMKKALSKKTRAVMVAHTLGNPFEVKKVRDFCKKHRLWFIEDNCDGLGSEYDGQRTGSFGDISTLSFYPAHHISTGEGGAIFTNNALLHKAIRSIRDWGRDCWCPTGKENTCGVRFNWKLGELPQGYDHKYIYSHIGYNLKMTDIQAACGLAQLKKLDSFIRQRRENYASLRKKLAKFHTYFDIVEATEKSKPSWFGLLLTLKDDCGFQRKDFTQYLNTKKIGTRLLFAGNITKQPYFINYQVPYRKIGDLKNTDKVMNQTLWLGVYPGITEEMIDWIAQSFEDYFEQFK
ncbi:MAG: lipopolysaccharide biosynthesis protein RfbH [Candidatus Moranbacteria bacterium]|nr:lipopolysaccharide biosynthesis protein RfbH [Candidatus Moranbacteria bacterium]